VHSRSPLNVAITPPPLHLLCVMQCIAVNLLVCVRVCVCVCVCVCQSFLSVEMPAGDTASEQGQLRERERERERETSWVF
jgi:hypothetical protein